MTNAYMDEVSAETMKNQAMIGLLLLVMGGVAGYAVDDRWPLIVAFAVGAGVVASGAAKAPKGSADRRFRWCVAATWLVLAVVGSIGFSSRFWG